MFHLAYFHKADDLIEQVVEEFIEELTEADLEPLTTGHLVTL